MGAVQELKIAKMIHELLDEVQMRTEGRAFDKYAPSARMRKRKGVSG